MPLSRRYTPEHPPAESCPFGLDMSFVIPPGVGIVSGVLNILSNTVPPVHAEADWTIGPVTVQGRAVYAVLSGGVAGRDYQLVWLVTDTAGNVWQRTTLVLCGETA